MCDVTRHRQIDLPSGVHFAYLRTQDLIRVLPCRHLYGNNLTCIPPVPSGTLDVSLPVCGVSMYVCMYVGMCLNLFLYICKIHMYVLSPVFTVKRSLRDFLACIYLPSGYSTLGYCVHDMI
jgi:hypothetical protein